MVLPMEILEVLGHSRTKKKKERGNIFVDRKTAQTLF